MRSLVFGCGPAGLIASHAITMSTGHPPVIMSKPRKSELFGAQYLHAPIPGLKATDTGGRLISYRLQGEADAYKAKVYGDAWHDRVSPEDLIGEHYAWNIRSAYDELWDLYSANVIHADLGGVGPDALGDLISAADFIVSSVPKPLLCYNGHTFSAQKVWAMGDAPERGQSAVVRVPDDTVVCNGQPEPSWYRAATVFGYSTVEWPQDSKPPLPGIAEAVKPLKDNCDCNPDVIHVGRYGKWKKGSLSHQAYGETMQALDSVR